MSLSLGLGISVLFSLSGLVFALILVFQLMKHDEGNETMVKIADAIREGSDAFLSSQYKWILIFVLIVFTGLIALYMNDVSLGRFWMYPPITFVLGAFVSGISGFIGMKIATRANARTAWAAKKSLNTGLRVAFSAGTIVGMTVVGLGLLSLTAVYWFLTNIGLLTEQINITLFAFGMGASCTALFARVGGGIYTKAADVGADLVGKIEAGIPEDDPRNPATIADNVGDNVGDVAGMGADLFESYVGSIIATIALSSVVFTLGGEYGFSPILAPILLAGFGIIASILGNFFVRTKDGATQEQLLWSLRKGVYVSSIFVVVFAYVLVNVILELPSGLFWAILAGLVAGNIIGYFTEYYTSDTYKPTIRVAESSATGSATVIISGLALGMRSTMIPVFTISVTTITAYLVADIGNTTSSSLGLYGIGMATVGMLSTLGITLSTDAYGPIADNAGGVAEMSNLDPEVRERTDSLDSLGNTTAATGKGFAIGSAALTGLTLLATLYGILESTGPIFNIIDPRSLVALFIGAMVPFFFSALTMEAVGKAAMAMVEEVRRQFREIPGIMERTTDPDYQRCVAISTNGSLKQMIVPTLLAVMTPIFVGILLGPSALLYLLSGCLVSGFSMAVMMANAGGAWDNAKKYIERGNLGGKGSDAHKAAVSGDTVGDPFKDTSGPSINILIKLMSMVSLVLGPFLAKINQMIF